jgi:hypothetical protein
VDAAEKKFYKISPRKENGRGAMGFSFSTKDLLQQVEKLYFLF